MPGDDQPERRKVLAMSPIITRADIPGLCDTLTALLREGGATVIICDVGAVTLPDAAVVDAVARLHLTARRQGCQIRLEHANARLRDLLALMGLDGVLPLGLSVEPQRQAEHREEVLGVEEGVDAGDQPV